MSTDSMSIIIKNKGSLAKPNFVYISGKEETPMGTYRMYSKFVINFGDSSKNETFFSSPDGIALLTQMLTNVKCPLYIESETVNTGYVDTIKKTFEVIQGFTSSISNVGKTKQTHSVYINIMSKMMDKSNSPSVKDTVVSSLIQDICKSLTTTQRSTVKDFSSFKNIQGSIESVRNTMVNTSVIDRISKIFLSPIDPSVFDLVRGFCIQYIGEGKKVSEESGHNLDVMKNNLLLVLGLFRRKLSYTYGDGIEIKVDGQTNSNNMNDINNTLSALLTNPKEARLLIKIMKKMTRFYPDIEKDIVSLEAVFGGDDFTSDMQNSFEFTRVANSKSKSSSVSYISGTESSPIPIYRTTSILKKVNVTVEPVKKPKFFSGDSSSDEQSSSDEEDEILQRNAKVPAKVPDKRRTVVNTINEIVNQDVVFVPLKTMKSLLKFLSEGVNPTANQENRRKATEMIKAINEGNFGNITTNLILDWWQNLFITKTKNGESFVLVGDTSGGKTFVSLMAMRILFNQYINETKARFIYLAPTPQLAILQFANILTAYPNYSNYFGICCKSIVNIPSSARILIGTPNEVKMYLTEVTYHRDTIISLDNIKNEMENAIANPFKEDCRTLIIDEIQTLSPTYVQDVEVEQVMECKAIEDVMRCVNYKRDSKCQVIGLSATLSPESIKNIETRISEITHIPDVSNIIYTHDDIGLAVEADKLKPGYVPIMKKPEIKAIRIDGYNIETFLHSSSHSSHSSHSSSSSQVPNIGETIYQQNLDVRAVEMIIRDAESRGVLPLAFFRESELGTIQMFKDHIDHMDRKNKECVIWHNLYNRYNDDINILGYDKMREIAQIDKWIKIIKECILDVISDVNADPAANISRFTPYKSLLVEFNRGTSINYSPELYGLIVEYSALKSGVSPFNREIHPFYRFGSVVNASNFFSLDDAVKKTDTILKKILIAQDADPSSNAGSIIPLIMRGIEYGCGILTSSIPLGIQLEIYKFINIKGKSESTPIPILFCEYGMSMGMNTSIMSVCICRLTLSPIGASEFKQIGGRPGRRGNNNGRAPIIYTFNISNTYLIDRFETLSFDLTNYSSKFFASSEVNDYLAKIMVKYENNKNVINEKSENAIEDIISGDTFKSLGGPDVLLVRKIQVAKYQVKEIFNEVRNINPSIANLVLRSMYSYLQRAELYSLNVQIR